MGWLLDLRDATGDAFQKVVSAAAATVEPPRRRQLESRRGCATSACARPRGWRPMPEVRLESRRRAASVVRLLVEFDRTGRPDYQVAKWRAYDALMATGGATLADAAGSLASATASRPE